MRPVLLFTLRLLAPSIIIIVIFSRDASQASATTIATASLFATNNRHDDHCTSYSDSPFKLSPGRSSSCPFMQIVVCVANLEGGDQMSSKSSKLVWHKQQKKNKKWHRISFIGRSGYNPSLSPSFYSHISG